MNDKQKQQIQCWIEDNHADANSCDLFEQAKAYDLGIGVKEDKHKAASLYREAMNQGDKKAKHNLAMLLVTEEGDLSDKPTGIQMLQELADERKVIFLTSQRVFKCFKNWPMKEKRILSIA